jgi:DNA-directed RNA polymerase specialized sigma24 family protein
VNHISTSRFRDRLDQDAVVERLRHGDLNALAQLFDGYAAYALLLAHHITRDQATAEHAVEGAMLELWRNPDGDHRGDLYARLLRSVHRRAIVIREESASPGLSIRC